MKKKEGFTLIELLAVIVILALIALIAVPLLMGVIDSTRKNAYKQSVYHLIDITSNDLGVDFKLPKNYHINDGVLTNDETGKNIDYKNKIDGTGYIYINEKEQTELKIGNDKWCVSKEYDEAQVTIVDGSCVVNWSKWMSEEELLNHGKTPTDTGVESKQQYNVIYTGIEWIWYRDNGNMYDSDILNPPTCTDEDLKDKDTPSCLCTDLQKQNKLCRTDKDVWEVNRSTSFRTLRINLGGSPDCSGSGYVNSSTGSYNIATGFGDVRNLAISFWNMDGQNAAKTANLNVVTASGNYNITNGSNPGANVMVNTRNKYVDSFVTKATITNAGTNTSSSYKCWSTTIRIEAYEKKEIVTKSTGWEDFKPVDIENITKEEERTLYRYKIEKD